MLTARQNGGLVFVRYDRRRVATYNAVRLTKDLIRLGESGFMKAYGFRYEPTKTTLLEARRQMDAR